MDAISLQKYLRISPKKMRELARLTVGMSPDLAASKLEFMAGKAPKILSAVIKSAKANAVNNLKLNPDNLVIKEVVSLKGPFFKRWQPVSRGTAHPIKKRTSHLRVVVAEKPGKKDLSVPEKIKELPSKVESKKEKIKEAKK